jgi:hypothetical protein
LEQSFGREGLLTGEPELKPFVIDQEQIRLSGDRLIGQ